MIGRIIVDLAFLHKFFVDNLAGWTEDSAQWRPYSRSGSFCEGNLTMAKLLILKKYKCWDYDYMTHALNKWLDQRPTNKQNERQNKHHSKSKSKTKVPNKVILACPAVSTQ